MSTGTWLPAARKRRQTSIPSRPGRPRSSTSASYGLVIAISSPAGPSLARSALLPAPRSAPAALSQLWDSTVGRSLENGPGDKGSVFTAAATYIGITEAQLRTELGTDKSLADVAVAHGKTRDGLIQALVAAQQQSIATLVDQKGIGARPAGPGIGRRPGGPRVTGDPLAAAATYLGTTTADLDAKIRAGQTLAQIANATS